MNYKLKKINTKNNTYLYDGVTSNILEMENKNSEAITRAIACVNDNKEDSTSEFYEIIDGIKNELIAKNSTDKMQYWYNLNEYLK